MKTFFITLFTAIFISFNLSAQEPQTFNSGEVIKSGVKLHDAGKYKEAINLYMQVPRIDTNYAFALYEMALSQMLDSNNKAAIQTCKEGLIQDNDKYEPFFFLIYGSIEDDAGNIDKAMNIYDSALLRYPNQSNLLLNKAIALMRQKKLNEAESLLQNLLVKYPYYSSVHFRLGQCALQKGNIIPAMMCFFTYLLNAPTGDHANSCIQLLSSISKQSDDIVELVSKRETEAPDNFLLVEKIVRSKIALDKNYKLKTSLDDQIVRQLQVVMEKLQYDENDSNFYMQVYVPYLKNLFNNGNFEPAVYEAFSNVDFESIKKYMKKNQKEVTLMLGSVAKDIGTLRTTRIVNYTKRQATEPTWYYENDELTAHGTLINGKPDGLWQFFFDNGNIKSFGYYLGDWHKEGKWTYYYADGKLAGYDNWKDGKQIGEDITYIKNGVVSARANFSDGKLSGEKTVYNAIGNPQTVENFSDEKENGPYVEYFNNGKKKKVGIMLNGELNGSYTSYYENGKLHEVTTYENGKINGSYKSYYDNGQLEMERTYKKGEIEGTSKTYFDNGKISSLLTYSTGVPVGEEIDYNRDGVIIQKFQYKDGKVNGLAQLYGDDGKLYGTLLSENDILKVAKYFDKNGKEISNSIREKNKDLVLTVFNENGFKDYQNIIDNKGQKQNRETYYYPSGKVKQTINYKDDKTEGILVEYYENGDKKSEVSYHNGQKNGEFILYYQHGKIKSKGWYTEGVLNGEWIEYNENGIVTTSATYKNDDLDGTKKEFYANGKLDYEEVYKYGWLTAIYVYDTLGNKVSTETFINGNGKYKGAFFNGKKRFECDYIKGEFNGQYYYYFINGQVQISKYFDHGILNGPYKEYFPNGRLSMEGEYDMGKKTGKWKMYTEDGHLYFEEVYVNNDLNGKMVYYHDNGKVEREIEYKDNERNGLYKRYSEDGQISDITYYKNGVIYGYSYNDKKGQLVPMIPLAGGIGKLKTYYSNGNVSAEMEFSDGKMIGAEKLYFPDGRLNYSSVEDYSKTTGRVLYYFQNGQPRTESNYEQDEQNGLYKEYYEDGKLKQEGNYYLGYPNGIFNYYDKSGHLTEKREYYYGLLMNISK